MKSSLSTEVVPPRDRLAYWEEIVCRTFVSGRCQAGAGAGRRERDRVGFSGRVVPHRLGALELTEVFATPQEVVRTQAQARGSDARFYLLSFVRAGATEVEQLGARACLQPGTWALYDTAYPYRLALPLPFDQVVVMLPREEIQQRVPEIDRLVANVGPSQGLEGRMVSRWLAALVDEFAAGSPDAGSEYLSNQTLDLVGGALNRFAGWEPQASSSLRTRALLLIDERLKGPISVEEIASALGVHRRSLARAFSRDEGGLSGVVRRQRVRQLQRELASSSASLTALAYEWGFSSPAQLSRVFRAVTGKTPSEFRALRLLSDVEEPRSS
ncbi:MAG: helix-turn-helix domain-containing protein [Myxococcota bacterium]